MSPGFYEELVMTHIKNMIILMAIAPLTALLCWAVWVWMVG